MSSKPGLAEHEQPKTEPASLQSGAEAPQDVLGKFELQRKLGSGGMGTVYLALDTKQKRGVALKVLPKASAENPALVKRFQAEAAAAMQLNHENIVSVFEAGQADGWLYIALEYVEGIDLHRLLKRQGPLPVRRTLEIVKQVAHALDHAFRQGIVHRDIKPSNMIIKRNGTVKLADMGLARSVDEDDDGMTRAGMTVGTVDYMAPEQARDSKSADIRSDIYSLGCAWYHMLTGWPPFPKGSVTNKLYAHIENPRPDPRERDPQIPADVSRIVQKMMARTARDRFHTPQELLDELERISVRPDAVSARFLSVLSDVVDGDVEPPPDSEFETGPLVPSSERTKTRPWRGNPIPSAIGDLLPEFAQTFGIVAAGLLAATAIWWVLVSLIPTAGG
ncbi:MAG: serine/threonine-protein kinase [Planctomycetaceae bacterium]